MSRSKRVTLRSESLEARRLLAADVSVGWLDAADDGDAKPNDYAQVAPATNVDAAVKYFNKADLTDGLVEAVGGKTQDLPGKGKQQLDTEGFVLEADKGRLTQGLVGQDMDAETEHVIAVGGNKAVVFTPGEGASREVHKDGSESYQGANGEYAEFGPNGEFDVTWPGAQLRDSDGKLEDSDYFSGNDNFWSTDDSSEGEEDGTDGVNDTVNAAEEAQGEAYDQLEADPETEEEQGTAGGDAEEATDAIMDAASGSNDPSEEDSSEDDTDDEEEEENTGDEGTEMPQEEGGSGDPNTPSGHAGGSDEDSGGEFTSPIKEGRGGLVGDPVDEQNDEGATQEAPKVGHNNGGLVTNPGEDAAGKAGARMPLTPMAVDALFLKWTGTIDPIPFV